MLENIMFHSCGALDSSMIRCLRICRMMSSGLMLTGHSSTQALQVVQARSSSSVM